MKKMNKLVAMLLAAVMVLGLMPAPAAAAQHDHAHTHGIEEYPVLAPDTETEVTLAAGEVGHFAFTPEFTAQYRFVALGSGDTKATLYDSEMNSVANGDDCWESSHNHATTSHFCVTADLTAGETYVLEYQFYFSSNSGTFAVLASHIHKYAEEVTVPSTCTEEGLMTYTCGCGDTYTEVTPTAHSYSDETGECIHCGTAYAVTGNCGENLTWSLDWFGKLTISGTGAMDDYTVSWSDSNPSPWYTDYSHDITSVVVEEGVTSVGSYAFYQCSNLASVTLADSVTALGTAAFNNCGMLTSIDLPDGITEIPGYCFNYCKLTEIGWPSGLTTIGQNAFQGCAFGDLVLPEGITTIGQNAFSGCSNLARLTLPASLTTLDAYAFYGMYSTKEFVFTGDAPSIGNYCFNYLYVTVWYPGGNDTWTNVINQGYGGTLTWKALCSGSHTWGEVVAVDATCETGSYTTATCTGCGFVTTSPEKDDALGHDLVESFKEPNCANWQYGYTEITCTRCDYYDTKDYVPYEHDYVTSTVEVTCTTNGYTAYTCSKCGDTYQDNIVYATGHSVSEWSEPTEATCTEASTKTGSCDSCAETVNEQVAPALGHEWDEENGVENADGSVTYECIRCDATYRTEGTALYLGDNIFTISGDSNRTTKTFTAEADGTLTITLNQMHYHNAWAWDNGYTSEYWSTLAIDYAFNNGFFNVFVNNNNSTYTIEGYETAANVILTAIEVKAGDVVEVEMGHLESSYYYGYDIQLNVNLALEVSEPVQPEYPALVLGENEFNMAASSGEGPVYGWTAVEDGTLTVEMTKLSMYLYSFWNDEPVKPHLQDGNITFKVNGEAITTESTTVAVKAGDVVTVQIGNYISFDMKAIVTLSFEAGSTEPEVLTLVLGDNTIELPASEIGEGPEGTWTAEEAGTLTVTLVSVAYHDDFMYELLGHYWLDIPVQSALQYNYYTFEVNGTATDFDGIATVAVEAGDTVTVKAGNKYGYLSQVVVNLAFAGGEQPHEHSFGEWTVTTAPTCTESGIESRSCACGETETREVAALGHTEEILPAVEATFDADGLTEGKKCAVCDETLVAQETVAKLDYNEGIVPVDVLTTTAGDSYSTDIPANVLDDDLSTMWHTHWYGTSSEGHWIQFELSETYSVDGLRYKPRTDLNRQGEPQLNGTITEYKILVSNDGESFEEITTGTWEANQNWKTVQFEAVTAKYIRLVSVDACTDNDYVFASASEIRLTGEKSGEQPHEHSFGEWTVTTAPTCTEAGVETRSCECGETETRETAALGHSWKGVECERCDATRENPFVDVPNDSFCIDPVLWAVEEGITTGTSATTFDPNGKCARAIVVTFLWRAAGSPEPTTTENPFTDVKESDFYYKAVLWAVENGITTGTSATTFSPTELCNRATVVTFLYRAMGSPEVSTTENPFSDVKVDSWYGPAVLWAVENGITNGMGDGTFGVGATCTRAQVVTFLYRTLVK